MFTSTPVCVFCTAMFQTSFAICICFNLALAIDLYYIDDSCGYGRQFDGIGGISGGGVSTYFMGVSTRTVGVGYIFI